ncbi:hypothetical protein FQZ97_756540 [compost metagenome]
MRHRPMPPFTSPSFRAVSRPVAPQIPAQEPCVNRMLLLMRSTSRLWARLRSVASSIDSLASAGSS